MSSHTYDYLDGNPAAGELSSIFAVDVTDAEAQMRIAAQSSASPRQMCAGKAPV